MIHVKERDENDVAQIPQTLLELLNSPTALAYFIQYLESIDKTNLIKFWLHVESFKSSVVSLPQSLDVSFDAAFSLTLIDARAIFDKYIVVESLSSLALSRPLREAVAADLQAPRPCLDTLFNDAQQFVYNLLELRYLPEFQSSVYHKKFQLEVLREGCFVPDIVNIPNLLISFFEFLPTPEHCNQLQFLATCFSYERSWNELQWNDAESDAMAIYEKYFSLQAHNPIVVSEGVRISIESLICTDDGVPAKDAFAAPKKATLAALDAHLKRFVQSSAYVHYLNELREHISSFVELPRSNGNRGSSVSGSTCDSLSQLCNRHFEQLSLRPLSSSLQYNNTRTNATQRGLAEMDSMGRYKPLYNNEFAYKSSDKKISARLRAYLSSKNEEHKADEVAQSIIADVLASVPS